jgi:hypothetical protein
MREQSEHGDVGETERRGGSSEDGWDRAWVGRIRPSVVGSSEEVVGRSAQDDDGVAQRAGATSRVDRNRVGDDFTLEDLHRGKGRLARDDGEVSVGEGRGGIEVGERHDLEERERGEERKKRETGCVATKEISEDENWFCERVWSERCKIDFGGPPTRLLHVANPSESRNAKIEA